MASIEMIDVLNRLRELDKNNPNVVKGETYERL